MSTTMRCPRCATELHLISTPTMDAPGIFRVVPHECFRFLVAEFWEEGSVIAKWTSENPGMTGPQDLVRMHAPDADQGWELPSGMAWTYRWQLDASADQEARS